MKVGEQEHSGERAADDSSVSTTVNQNTAGLSMSNFNSFNSKTLIKGMPLSSLFFQDYVPVAYPSGSEESDIDKAIRKFLKRYLTQELQILNN